MKLVLYVFSDLNFVDTTKPREIRQYTLNLENWTKPSSLIYSRYHPIFLKLRGLQQAPPQREKTSDSTNSTMFTKVSGSNLVTYLNQIPVFEWCAVRCRSKNGHQKDMCLERDWTMCSTFVDYSWLNSQHIWGGHMCLLTAHCQRTLIIRNYLRSASNLYAIDAGFFRHICGYTKHSIRVVYG